MVAPDTVVQDDENSHEVHDAKSTEDIEQQDSDDDTDEDVFYECYTTQIADEEDKDELDMEQMKADNRAARLPSMKESMILDSYIMNEGAVQEMSAKCGKCVAADCKGCIKAERASPKEEAVLTEMKEGMKKIELEDGLYQFNVSYIAVSYTHLRSPRD